MEKKKPEIRFNGFEGEWVTTTLGDIAVRVVSKNEDNSITLPLTISAQYGLISQTEFFNSRIAAKDVRGYYVIKKGEFAYNRSTSDFSPFGAVKRLDGYEAGVLSTLYIVFRLSSEQIQSNYLVNYFSTSNWYQHITESAAEGARNHGLLNITAEDFFKTPIKAPIRTEEQEKIASFLTTLDKLIAKLEAKLDKLRKLKQALLEKMFANVNGGGYETPEIRFKGYTDKWQVNNVASIFETYYDKNHPNLPVLSASQEFGMVIRDNVGFQVQHNKENEVGYKRVLPGQFVIHLRSFQGGFAHSMVEGITSPAYTVMQFKKLSKQDDIYWKYVLTSKIFIKRLETVTYGIRDGRSISFEDFSELDFTFPSLSEQEQIGKCFTQIDTHFNKTSTKLTKLRNIKHSLLQKMFA